jgi:transposase InsO family protein
MRYSQPERMEIIRLVEQSELSVTQTLQELGVPESTFYRWYKRYREAGYDGLADRKPGPRQFWNRIPDEVREQVVDVALERPEQSSREVAWFITDHEGYFISESSVYRILKAKDLVTSPVFRLVSASDRFENPTTRVNEMWQTDFTQLKVIGWGWYYLCTVLDDYSRYILAWRLAPTMASEDVKRTLDIARERTAITEQIVVQHRPRLLSDNGPSFVSQSLARYLDIYKIKHVRGAPYHPQTQGKIERYHRSMKNIVKLDNYYFPWQLEQAIAAFVDYYNHHRYHEALDNLIPADVYFGRAEEVKARRAQIKQKTLQERRNINFQMMHHSV